MDKKVLIISLLFIVVILTCVGVLARHYFFIAEEEMPQGPVVIRRASVSVMQKEAEQLSNNYASELQDEQKLSLSLVPNLKALKNSLELVKDYAEGVEKDIDMIAEISNKDFQENVMLQAVLFKNKKPALVAKHLQELDVNRAGAILSKMTEEEAANILDFWSQNENNQLSNEVIAAYISCKRHDLHPELYENIAEESLQRQSEYELSAR
jgi:flagellar motility protein MotE (MotC chaperone)